MASAGGALTTTPSYNLQFTPATVNNVTGNGEIVKVAFATSYTSKGGTFDFSTNTFTAPVTGFYKFSVTIGGKGTGNNLIQVSFECTGGTYYVINQQATSTGGYFFKAASQVIYMTASDTMYVNYSVTGIGATTAGYYGGGNTGSYLTGFYVGT